MTTPQLLTRKALAAALGCNIRTISKWETEGFPLATRGRGGRSSLYDESACRAWQQARQTHVDGPVDVARQRARKELAQAKLAEQTFAARARLLLPADEVERAWSAEQAAIRARLLALPQAYADRLARAVTLHGTAGAEAAIREMVDEVLTEFAAGPSRVKRRKKRKAA